MNILQLSEDYYPKTSGGAFEDFHVSKRAASCGESVTVFTFRRGDLDAHEQTEGVDIRRPVRLRFANAPINSPLNVLGRVFSAALLFAHLIAHLRKTDTSVIYSTNHLMHPLAAILGRAFNLPVVSLVAYTPSLREEVRWIDPLYLLEQINFRLFMGNFVHTRNPEIREAIKQYNPDATVQITHGILDTGALENVQYRIGVPSDTTTVAFVGRLTELKSPKTAVETIHHLPREYELIVIGDGPQRERVKREAFNLHCEDRVRMLGEIPHKDVLEVLLASDVLLLTSKVESYPTVVFEALACSCAVVAPPVGILPHIENNHPSLTITQRDDYESAIQYMGRGRSELDQEFANAYSINRFADSVRQSFALVSG